MYRHALSPLSRNVSTKYCSSLREGSNRPNQRNEVQGQEIAEIARIGSGIKPLHPYLNLVLTNSTVSIYSSIRAWATRLSPTEGCKIPSHAGLSSDDLGAVRLGYLSWTTTASYNLRLLRDRYGGMLRQPFLNIQTLRHGMPHLVAALHVADPGRHARLQPGRILLQSDDWRLVGRLALNLAPGLSF
jgi:hypothetical protein